MFNLVLISFVRLKSLLPKTLAITDADYARDSSGKRIFERMFSDDDVSRHPAANHELHERT